MCWSAAPEACYALCAYQGDDPGACETRVVQLLGLDNFELAKELLKNRLKIVCGHEAAPGPG